MIVALLTTDQKDQLVGKEYTTDSYFNPIQDLNDNWVVSVEEIDSCTNEDFAWIKDLQLITYEPKEQTPIA
jgi:hypothetical protein